MLEGEILCSPNPQPLNFFRASSSDRRGLCLAHLGVPPPHSPSARDLPRGPLASIQVKRTRTSVLETVAAPGGRRTGVSLFNSRGGRLLLGKLLFIHQNPS